MKSGPLGEERKGTGRKRERTEGTGFELTSETKERSEKTLKIM